MELTTTAPVFYWVLLQAVFNPDATLDLSMTRYLADKPNYFVSEKDCKDSPAVQLIELHEIRRMPWSCMETNIPIVEE